MIRICLLFPCHHSAFGFGVAAEAGHLAALTHKPQKVPSLADAIVLNVSICVNVFLFEREGWGSQSVCERERWGEVQYPSLLC